MLPSGRAVGDITSLLNHVLPSLSDALTILVPVTHFSFQGIETGPDDNHSSDVRTPYCATNMVEFVNHLYAENVPVVSLVSNNPLHTSFLFSFN